MYRVKANLTLITGLFVVGVIALASCGKKTEGPTGNSSSYPGNFLALCQSSDKTPALEKTFAALLTSPTESCLDAHTRLMELDEIDLSGKGLSDIRPLASFIDLKSLYLDHNQISSAAALAGLFKLEKLDMSWNDLSSAAPLAELARLETLYLFGNPLGNDVAKTSENCPYDDVGKGLRTFCTPPESKSKKRTPVVIVNKNPSTKSSKTSSNKKTTSNDDIDDGDHASDKSKDKRPSREDDQPAEDHPQQQSSSSKPKGEDKSDKADDKATAQKAKRKRAWETSFVPPEDDVDDWGEDADSSEEMGERGLTDSPAADSADADIDKAMNKEIAKSTIPKPEAQKSQAQATDASTRPFSTPAPQDVAGKQTTAHSWDQAVGRVFDKTKPGAAGQQPHAQPGGQQEFDWDLVEDPASLDLGAELGGLGQPATSRRVPVDMEAGLTPEDAADSSAAADDESTSFWSSTLLRTLGLGFQPEPEQQKVPQPKSPVGKGAQGATRGKAQQKPASRAQHESVAQARVPAVAPKTMTRPTPKAATRIKSFLAYCLDHSGQPAIAHTIKVLTKPGETCLASYRRLAAAESLDLSGKQLTDIAPLASFRNLRKLDLAHNRIGDLKPLAGLTQLNWLNIDHNGLVDIAHLGRLAALVHLTAKHNRIFSVSPLAKLSKLNTIAIKGNPIATDAAKNSSTCPKDAQSRSVQSLCQ